MAWNKRKKSFEKETKTKKKKKERITYVTSETKNEKPERDTYSHIYQYPSKLELYRSFSFLYLPMPSNL